MSNSITAIPVSCFQSMQHRIYDASNAIFERCVTDTKIYTLLTSGRLIHWVSITALALSAYSIVFLDFTGLIGAISSLFRTYIAKMRPFIPGQPIGLTNPCSDCWLNSSLQVLKNVPAFQERMQRIPEYKQFCDQYEAAATNQHKVSPDFDSNVLRQFLNTETNGQIRDGDFQEDAAQVFECLFRGNNALFRFAQKVNGALPMLRLESMIQIQIDPDQDNAHPALQELFSHYFDHLTDERQQIQLSLAEAPQDLLIQFKIFYQRQDDNNELQLGKILTPLEISPRLILGKEFVQTEVEAQYECDAFVRHLGETLDSGHYIAYVKKAEKWWCCSDATVYEVSEGHVQQELPYAYICHYAKIASNMA